MKRVIFIGGTSYSGSTFINLMLGNAPDAFSCGEVSFYFRPIKQKYLNPDCSCGNPDCTVWPQLKSKGEANLYENIFKMFPHINTIVDSSKNPLWINDMTRNLKDSGIACKNLLIWKSPEEFRLSRAKRGREHGWRRAWINYHRSYFLLVKDFTIVKYSEIAKNPGLLKPLCDCLDIPYHEEQDHYWEKIHHSLYGNSSANIHLHQQNSNAFSHYEKEIKDTWKNYGFQENEHQAIKYDSQETEQAKVNSEIEKDELVERIVAFLESRDFQKHPGHERDNLMESEIDHLKALKIWPMLQRAHYFMQTMAINH